MFYLEKLVGSRGGLAPMHRWAGMLLCKCQSCQAFWGSLLSAGRQVYLVDVTRWDEKAGLRRDAIRSQVIDALEAQEIKETDNEED